MAIFTDRTKCDRTDQLMFLIVVWDSDSPASLVHESLIICIIMRANVIEPQRLRVYIWDSCPVVSDGDHI